LAYGTNGEEGGAMKDFEVRLWDIKNKKMIYYEAHKSHHDFITLAGSLYIEGKHLKTESLLASPYKDPHGQRIFEADILGYLSCQHKAKGGGWTLGKERYVDIAEVVFRDGSFQLEGGNYIKNLDEALRWQKRYHPSFEIIGNSKEYPELLEKES
jgi:hypothetical protein